MNGETRCEFTSVILLRSSSGLDERGSTGQECMVLRTSVRDRTDRS